MQKIKHYTIQIQIIKIFNTNENDTIQLKTLYNKKNLQNKWKKIKHCNVFHATWTIYKN